MEFHNRPNTDEHHVKIRFELSPDADGYPPATAEYLWATRVGDNRYQIDNIPFFVTGISYEDVVIAKEEAESIFRFESLSEEKGHSTVRIILYDCIENPDSIEMRTRKLRDTLSVRGCAFEQSHIPGLIAIDIPPEADFHAIRLLLHNGVEDRLWDYEEATVAHAQN